MAKKLFIGNIDWNATNQDLIDLFSQYGEIEAREDGSLNAVIIKDKFTGRSRWFGFVTFVNDEDAITAMEKLEGYELNDRPLAVKEAEERAPRNED